MEKLILIDGNSLINRAFYATPLLSNKNGLPTNAVLGFTNMLLRLISEEKPEYMLVAFDRKEPTFRHEMYAEYKGTRKPMPEELRPQIDALKDVLDAMRIARFEQPGIEADDVIGTVSRLFPTKNLILTGDKDSFQLVNENTTVLFTRRGISDTEAFSAENFKEKTGIDPAQIIDLKALMGDSSDNIPGVPGVGEKTAKDLLSRYESIENLYEHTDELTGKLKEKIEEGRELCFLSKRLATIDLNVFFDKSLEDLRVKMPLPKEARAKFVELEFRSIVKKAELFETQSEQKSEEKAGVAAPDTVVVSDEKQIEPLFGKKLAIHIGDTVSLSDGEKEYSLLIKRSFFDEGFEFDGAIKALKPVFEDENARIIVFSKKKLRHTLATFGIDLKAFADDVSLEKYIVDFSGKEEDLNDLLIGYDLPESCPAFSLYVLSERLIGDLKQNDQLSLYCDVELPLSDVLYDMETAGFKVDENIIHELNEKYKAILTDLSEKIYELAGEKFNVNSPKQLGTILFEKLGLNPGKKKKGSFSTGVEVLEEISDNHEIVPLILKYRRIAKLNSTYIEGFLPLVDKRTGLIHTVFNQTLTATGRLSSKEPNLQNLPIRNEEGREIRRFFVPSDGEHILVGADYSQIELRLLAHFSECEKLVEAYKNDEDIHSLTASEVFGVPIGSVTKEMRRSAKAVNFGIIYGISEYGLAKNIKISPREAKKYIDRYFASYPNVKEYMEKNVEFARKNGYVSTLCGRKRFIRDINSPNYNLRSFSERAAMNMPLQGSSADIIKIAMINVFSRLKRENLKSRLILQVHDELIIDALKTEKEQVEKLLKEEMENAVKLRVPLTVEVYSGASLNEAK
ncbi:MAG: DNA polymerase I [Clostridia bacterium]|nr:DNA polymerase I [Clostridia bacterium]